MKPLKILFANFPADGHFNPLTTLANHLKLQGHDVRWYTSRKYESKITRMSIPFYPLVKALDFASDTVDQLFPERKKAKSAVAKLKFDIKNAFILRGSEYFEDIKEINKTFNFDILIADIAFTGIPFVKDLLSKPVVGIGVLPLAETSKDLPPTGLGLAPVYSFWGKQKQGILRWFADNIIFKESTQLKNKVFKEFGVKITKGNIFDTLYRKCDLVLQSGTPGFEYKRSDLSNNIRFIGPLLPYKQKQEFNFSYLNTMEKYDKVILVTQGTVETDVEKIIVPTLEAFKNSKHLVVATTGGARTEELKKRYPYSNVIIEDFIPFDAIMPFTSVYITNGGYGGVMLGIQNKLPMVVAGIHEGKNEINARVGYFELGINLNKENPTSGEIKRSVHQIFSNDKYKINSIRLSQEFKKYRPEILCERYVYELLDFNKPSTFSASSVYKTSGQEMIHEKSIG